jgi:RNA methyltransferase, TrmH family
LIVLTKNQIKFIKSLGKKRERDANGVFVAEGPKLVNDIIACGGKVMDLFGLSSWISENAEFIDTHKLNYIEVSASEMGRITELSTPSLVLAIFHQPVEAKSESPSGSILILDDLRDPGNLGTIIRTADWFGIKTIICSPETVDCFNPKVIQSTMGSILRVSIRYVPLADFIRQHKAQYTFYGTFMDGNSIKSLSYANPSAFIIGNEAHGISKEVEQLIHQRIAIPGNQKADGIEGPESLNAAIATSVVLYDWFLKK